MPVKKRKTRKKAVKKVSKTVREYKPIQPVEPTEILTAETKVETKVETPVSTITKMVTAKPVPKPVSKEKKFYTIPKVGVPKKEAPVEDVKVDPLKKIVDKDQADRDAKALAMKELAKSKEANDFARRSFLAWKLINSKEGKELIDILKDYYSPAKYAKDSISMKNYFEAPEKDRFFILGKLRMLEEIEFLAIDYDKKHKEDTKLEVK